MKSGDQVILVVREAGKPSRLALKELLIDEAGVLAITTPWTAPGWPERLRLRPARLEASPMPPGPPGLYVYQDDVVRPV